MTSGRPRIYTDEQRKARRKAAKAKLGYQNVTLNESTRTKLRQAAALMTQVASKQAGFLIEYSAAMVIESLLTKFFESNQGKSHDPRD